MLDGVNDTSGAILLFDVRPFAENSRRDIDITNFVYPRSRTPGVEVNLHGSKSNAQGMVVVAIRLASSSGSAPERIRTTNLLIRSQMLYPVELRALERGC